MRTVRKWLAFMLAAGLMVSAMTVFADDDISQPIPGQAAGTMGSYGSGSGIQQWSTNDDLKTDYYGEQDPKDSCGQYLKPGDTWQYTDFYYVWSGNGWEEPQYDDSCGDSSSGSSSSSSSKSAAEKAAEAQAKAEEAAMQAAQAQASREAVALAGAASDEGFADIGDMYRASQKSMSAGEFYNNVVVSTPGIENAVTVGQGGNLVVNGQVTNMSASIGKVTNRAYVDSVRIEQEGTVLNVVEVSYPAVEATINFYMPGITGEENIVALQYNAGTWVNVEVAEIRADHVTLNMKGNGVVAFIAK